MDDQERVTLNRNELKKLKVLERIESGAMSAAEGAETLDISTRQMRRLRAAYKSQGSAGIIHGNRGRKPTHAIDEATKEEVWLLYKERYFDFNFTHYAEMLRGAEGIFLSDASVGRILREKGARSKVRKRRRPAVRHTIRERRSQAGMLWQTDATPFAWLGSGHGRFALHAVIDDATSRVVAAYFTRNECAAGYSECMKQALRQYGIPMALYTDRHTIFVSPNEERTIDQELDGVESPLSNFGYALAELGIEHIKALSPQAKGRIERLWVTLQDRLPGELRLLGVRDIDEANAVLPKLIEQHNAKYAVAPADPDDAYVEIGETDLDMVFASRSIRKVDNGSSIRYDRKVYVAADASDALPPHETVEVRETASGDVAVMLSGRVIKLKELDRPRRQAMPEERKFGSAKVTPHRPGPDHPWRHLRISKRSREGRQVVKLG